MLKILWIYITEKINNFYQNYIKYQSKYAFNVVMNNKEFIVYLIDSNKITKVTYVYDFVIPCMLFRLKYLV